MSQPNYRAVPCPFCEVPAGALCVGPDGRPRDAEHYSRQILEVTGHVSRAATQRQTLAYADQREQMRA
jgi:hypothetical protein